VERVADVLRRAPEARAVFLVEPSFVGVVSDVAGIAARCHAAGMPLIVDQAWGAHLGFHPDLPAHTLALGADAMVTSAHKTLTGFTESAYLFARGPLLDLRRVDEAFDALHTTSVAAAILASLDRTRALLAARGEELLARTVRLAERARAALREVDGLYVPGAELVQAEPSVAAYDPTKLVLALPGTGADGMLVERDLVERGVRVELANRDTLIPLLTIGDTELTVTRLVDALRTAIDRRRGAPRPAGGASAVWSVEPEQAMRPRDAFFAPRETVPAARAAGRVAAETIAPYPPGIPAIAPGEVIGAELLAALREAAADGTRLAYCADPTLRTVQVVA
jgi:lysine decarboxylase